MSRGIKSGLLSIACIVCVFLSLGRPELTAQGFENGLRLCIFTVLPALFPFFVLCGTLMDMFWKNRPCEETGRFSGMDTRKLLVVLLSWIGGYAVAARLTGQLYGQRKVSNREASVIMLLGCCSSPGFVIGSVGGLLLGNIHLGILLYCIQLASNLLSTVICLPALMNIPTAITYASPVFPVSAPKGNVDTGLSGAIQAAVNSSLQVCGCVIFFRTMGSVLLPFLPKLSLMPPVFSAVLEISAGCADFAALGGNVAIYGCCFCMSLLGLSVWMQIFLLLQGAVPLRLLALARFLHLPISFLLTRLLIGFLPGSTAVYNSLSQRVIPMHRLPLDAAIIAFIFLCASLYKVWQNFYNK